MGAKQPQPALWGSSCALCSKRLGFARLSCPSRVESKALGKGSDSRWLTYIPPFECLSLGLTCFLTHKTGCTQVDAVDKWAGNLRRGERETLQHH